MHDTELLPWHDLIPALQCYLGILLDDATCPWSRSSFILNSIFSIWFACALGFLSHEGDFIEAAGVGRVIPHRALRGGGGLAGDLPRSGENTTQSLLFAMYLDDISSLVRRAWLTVWLPQLRRSAALAEELKATAETPEEGERLALREKARTFARLIHMARQLLMHVEKQYESLRKKPAFRYFSEHVMSTLELSFIFALKLLAAPAIPVGDLAYLAHEDERNEIVHPADNETLLLKPDGSLAPITPDNIQSLLAAHSTFGGLDEEDDLSHASEVDVESAVDTSVRSPFGGVVELSEELSNGISNTSSEIISLREGTANDSMNPLKVNPSGWEGVHHALREVHSVGDIEE